MDIPIPIDKDLFGYDNILFQLMKNYWGENKKKRLTKVNDTLNEVLNYLKKKRFNRLYTRSFQNAICYFLDWVSKELRVSDFVGNNRKINIRHILGNDFYIKKETFDDYRGSPVSIVTKLTLLLKKDNSSEKSIDKKIRKEYIIKECHREDWPDSPHYDELLTRNSKSNRWDSFFYAVNKTCFTEYFYLERFIESDKSLFKVILPYLFLKMIYHRYYSHKYN